MKKISFKILIILFVFLISGCVFAITIESKKQEIQMDKNKGFFSGDVKVQVGDVTVESPRAELDIDGSTKKPSLATFFDKPYAHQTKGNKKHEVKADIIKVSLIKKIVTAQGNAQTNILENKQPVVIISADMQEYNTNNHLMKASGSVIINYEDMVATSDDAYALLDKNGDVHNIKLISKATIKQDKSTIKGDSIQYSKLREDIIVSGNTLSDITFENGDRVVTTARNQQYNKKTNTILASGKVHVLYANYVADGPKAVIDLNPKTNKPDRIVFTGRSKIVQDGANSVEADKIILLTNPKTFEATGNVKTFIENNSQNSKDTMEFSL